VGTGDTERDLLVEVEPPLYEGPVDPAVTDERHGLITPSVEFRNKWLNPFLGLRVAFPSRRPIIPVPSNVTLVPEHLEALPAFPFTTGELNQEFGGLQGAVQRGGKYFSRGACPSQSACHDFGHRL
jgi:hypothetical protein